MFFYKFLLKWGKMKKILSPPCTLKLKNIILFLNWGLIFFSNGYIHNVVSTLPNVVKIGVENNNVVSTLSFVVQFKVEKHNVVSTLFYVVKFNVDVHNVVSTLIWRCTTSRRHINVDLTLCDVATSYQPKKQHVEPTLKCLLPCLLFFKRYRWRTFMIRRCW